MAEKKKYIRIKGACEHNLKNIDIDIPRDEFTVNHLWHLILFMQRDREGIWSHCLPMPDSF